MKTKTNDIPKELLDQLLAGYSKPEDLTGPDGLLYVLLQNPTGAGTGLALSAPAAGMVIRLVPVP